MFLVCIQKVQVKFSPMTVLVHVKDIFFNGGYITFRIKFEKVSGAG